MIADPPDLYAVLQVSPDAESEVIDAAYRQLMRKYHPDVAHGDPTRAAELHQRAKLINQAYTILRNPSQRREYDRLRLRGAWVPSAAPPPAGAPTAGPSAATSSAAAANAAWTPPPSAAAAAARASANGPEPTNPSANATIRTSAAVERGAWWVVDAPMNMVGAAYYLLPGPYEWEPASKREQLFTMLVPPLGVLGWLAVSGRLAPLFGASMQVTAAVGVIIALVLLLVDWRSLPRLAVAAGLLLALISGVAQPALASSSLPPWLAWLAVGLVGVLLSARPFLFGLMPTIVTCWLLSRVP